MGVKNHIRLALLFVCLMVVGIALYPYVPRIVKNSPGGAGRTQIRLDFRPDHNGRQQDIL